MEKLIVTAAITGGASPPGEPLLAKDPKGAGEGYP